MAKIKYNQIEDINDLDEKVTIAANDVFLLEDSEDLFKVKRFKATNLPSGGSSTFTYTDATVTTEGADYLPLYDDSDGSNPKKSTISNIISDNNIALTSDLTGFLEASDNISLLTNDSGFITGYTVTEGDVTAHEAALTITESQISDLSHFIPTDLPTDYGITLGTVATSNDYNDLDNKPTTFTPAPHTHTVSDITDFPTNVSDFTNDVNYTTRSETGSQLSANPVGSTISLLDVNGMVLDTLNVAFLNNEGTVIEYDGVTKSLLLKNDQGDTLSTIPVADFVTNVGDNLNLNGTSLELRDSVNTVLSTVTLTVANIQGLQSVLENEILVGTGTSVEGNSNFTWSGKQLLLTDTESVIKPAIQIGTNGRNVDTWGQAITSAMTFNSVDFNSFADMSLINLEADEDTGYGSFDTSVMIEGIHPVNHFYGYQARQRWNSASTLPTSSIFNSMTGFMSGMSVEKGNVENLVGFLGYNTGGNGTVQNQYGVYIEELTKGTVNNYGVYSLSNNYLKSISSDSIICSNINGLNTSQFLRNDVPSIYSGGEGLTIAENSYLVFGDNKEVDLGFGGAGDMYFNLNTGTSNLLIRNSHINIATLERDTGNLTLLGNMKANKFIKDGGTSSQYLMADGSVIDRLNDNVKMPIKHTSTNPYTVVNGDYQLILHTDAMTLNLPDPSLHPNRVLKFSGEKFVWGTNPPVMPSSYTGLGLPTSGTGQYGSCSVHSDGTAWWVVGWDLGL